jgi:hypothetical protein
MRRAVCLLVLSGCGESFAEGPRGGFTPGLYDVADVRAGYAKYAEVLAGDGVWRADLLYGRRWCPRAATQEPFVPYRSGGHWGPSKDDAQVPAWVLDSAAPWVAITMRHGWWRAPEPGEAGGTGEAGSWCWVPGAEEAEGRLLWRAVDGLVGWAPEPVLGNFTSADADALPWTYAPAARLFEAQLDRVVLRTDEAELVCPSPVLPRGPRLDTVMLSAPARRPRCVPGASPGGAYASSTSPNAQVQAPVAATGRASSGTSSGIGGGMKLLGYLVAGIVRLASR